MIKKLYPHWLRAIHVREDMVWITIKNAPGGAWEKILTAAGTGLLLGSPRDGWLRAAVSASDAEQIAKMCEVSALPDIRVLDIYGTDMREMGLPILRTLEESGAQILGVSLSTQRMSAALRGNLPAIDWLSSRFPMEL